MTKTYCSRECLLKDNEENHSKFCQKGEEERKVKGDAKARVEAGLKGLEVGLKNSLKLEGAPKNRLVEVMELCQKRQMKDEGKSSRKGRGKK